MNESQNQKRTLGASHVLGGCYYNIFLPLFLLTSPQNGQDYSDSVFSQPSPLRFDLFEAMGLTLFLAIAPNFEWKRFLIAPPGVIFMTLTGVCTFILILRCRHKYQFLTEETRMPAVLEDLLNEELISEKIEHQVEECRRQLESAFRNEEFWTSVRRVLNELEQLLATNRTQKRGFLVISDKLSESRSKIAKLSEQYERCLEKDKQEKLDSLCTDLKNWEKLIRCFCRMPAELSGDSSTNAFKCWASGLKMLAKLIHDYPEQLEEQEAINFFRLAQYASEASDQPLYTDRCKERYRRQVRETSGFIIWSMCNRHIQKSQEGKAIDETGSWKLILRERPYNQLLKESQSKIDSLDQLYSEEENEAREQAETLEYLARELKKPNN